MIIIHFKSGREVEIGLSHDDAKAIYYHFKERDIEFIELEVSDSKFIFNLKDVELIEIKQITD